MKLLLENGASVNIWALGTPLHRAITADAQKVVGLLLDRGAGLETRDEKGMLPLAMAANRGQLDMIRLLLQRGADVNAFSGVGFSALHYSAESGNVEAARLLLSHHADVNTRKPKSYEIDPGTTPLHVSASNGRLEMSQFLVEQGAEINAVEYSPLVKGFSHWREPKPGLPSSYGRTPLHYAAMHNHLEVAEFLLKHGADVNQRDLYDWTALDYASDVSVGRYFTPFDKPKTSAFPEMEKLLSHYGAKARSWWTRNRERTERSRTK